MLKIYRKLDGLKVALMPQAIMYAEQLESGLAIKMLNGTYHELDCEIAAFTLNLMAYGLHSQYIKEDGMYISINRSLISSVEDCGSYRSIHFCSHTVRVIDSFSDIIVEGEDSADKRKKEFKEYFNFKMFNLN